jgi:integrase
MRLGELSALTWGDIDLVGATIRVRQCYTGGELSTPKNHEQRSVDLTAELVELLGAWWGELGKPEDGTLVPSRRNRLPEPDHGAPARALPGDEAGRHPARRADGREANLPFVPSHAREGGA